MKGMGYFLFCGRCGTPEAEGLFPRTTLRIRFLRVDTEGTIFLSCVCQICLTNIEIPWTVEENLKAIEEAKFKDIDQFRDELDDGSFWDNIGGDNDD